MAEKKAKILVVDDEPDVRDTLKRLLSIKGYEVMCAFNGEEALRILEREKADLILLDIMMPGIKGTEVAKLVKQLYPNMKIMVVTGYPQEVEPLSGEHLLDSVFVKPVHIQELYNKLVDTLSQKQEPLVDWKIKQGIKARVLLIKAKILFIEPSLDLYTFLNTHFKELGQKGENYELEVVFQPKKITEKLESFEPDMFLVNACFQEVCNGILSEVVKKNPPSREIIVYNAKDIKNFKDTELDKLTRAVETACFKRGLVEIKWIEV